jgi:hypothetical protein
VKSGQQPAKKAVRKSKKSWELICESLLKSDSGAWAKKAVRKSKKSWELRAPSALKSPGHSSPPAATTKVRRGVLPPAPLPLPPGPS